MDEFAAPERNYLLKVGPLSYYWILVNEGSGHQHRCYIISWHTKRNLVHLSGHTWMQPLTIFPKALLASWRALRRV